MRRLIFLVILAAIVAAGVIVYGHNHNRANSVIQQIQQLNPNSDGSCPNGYVQYGQPINKCVPQKYYNECFVEHTRQCPL